ncbi:hypothetical protein ACFSC4_15325 [Deinococcus malanensis]|uniref:hypothetical protein n=1 Tax=Deinococcus malanensis TaxID=1706855 RepID=UPI00362F8751
MPEGALQGWYAYANQKQAARLAGHMKVELGLIHKTFPAQVDHAYLRSDAFQANVVQAVRAAEVAESEDKLHFIARALASCTLAFAAPTVDRFQTLRLIEAISDRELRVFVEYFRGSTPSAPLTMVCRSARRSRWPGSPGRRRAPPCLAWSSLGCWQKNLCRPRTIG